MVNIATKLELDKRETRKVTSASPSSGYQLTLTCDPEMTGDRYRAELDAWHKQRMGEAADAS